MKRFKNILCVIDPVNPGRTILERAVNLAINNSAELTVIDVIPGINSDILLSEGGPNYAELQAALVTDHEQKLSTLVKQFRGRVSINIKILTGDTFLETIREVLRNQHDLLLKTPECSDWLDRLFASEDMHLLRKCPCPVWLDKINAPKSYQRIMAAVDVDESCSLPELTKRQNLNRQILEMAFSLASTENAELHVVSVWQAAGENLLSGKLSMSIEKVTEYVELIRRQRTQALNKQVHEVGSHLVNEGYNSNKPKIHLIKGLARKEIPALAKNLDIDLIVMGTVARTGIPGFFMGNTAETILSQIECSVLAVKPSGFVTPVTLE